MITLVENSLELRGILQFTRFFFVHKFYFAIIINANYGICVIAAVSDMTTKAMTLFIAGPRMI
jgi:imidazoleglycerol phosphate synthase glutamine amidotransferase subunit HisH